MLQLPLKPWGSHCPVLTEREVSCSFTLVTATFSIQTKQIKTVKQKKMTSRPNYKLDMEIKWKSVMSDSLQPRGLYSPRNSPGQKIEVDSHSLLQGIFPTQKSNPGLSHCRQILYQLNHKGSPDMEITYY